MALRTIDYTVSVSGISPATQQFGGWQGEHNATELKFTLNADLLESIRAQAGENEVVYRFDVYDGAGGVTSTDPVPLTDSPPSYLLENKVSRMGGNVQVFLIITEIKNGETQMDLYSFPAVLRLKEKQEGEVSDAENYESISTLAEVAKKSASVAENSAAIAKEAQIKTEESKIALESGAEIVFLGGDSKSSVKIDIATDDKLSDVSTNPVQNKVLNKSYKELVLSQQQIASLYIEDETYKGCYYRIVDGEKEWVNPPMNLDVEYRTTERHLGKAVYVQKINLGNLPNGASKTVLHDLKMNESKFVGAETIAVKLGTETTSYSYYVLPAISDTGTILAKARYGANAIWVYASTNMSEYKGYTTLRYTKQKGAI